MTLETNMIRSMTLLFNKAGFSLFEVGGYLRDELLGKASHDIDLTTNARPEQTLALLIHGGYEHIYTVGMAYGTIGAIVEGQHVEITTFRGEVYPTESRKPIVTYGDSLLDDLSRRDFTINSMARDPSNGCLVDPFKGEQDLKNRIIRCVGLDDARFSEDPLRMLRAVRFACQLGFELNVVINKPESLVRISDERIREELNKILLSPNPARGIDLLVNTNLMRYIVPEFYGLIDLGQGKNHIKDAYEHTLNVLNRGKGRDHGEDNLVFRLACLFHDIGKQFTYTQIGSDVHFYNHQTVGAMMTRDIMKRLTYSNEECDRVCKLVDCHMMPLQMRKIEITPRIVRRFIRNIGSVNLGMLFDLNVCDVRATRNDRVTFLQHLNDLVQESLLEQPEEMVSPIDGNEIMAALHLPPGRMIGEIKQYLTDKVVDGALEYDDKIGAINMAEAYLVTLL